MSAKVKICGVTTVSDAQLCATAGADYLGLNFWPRSRRVIDASLATDLAAAARAVRPDIAIVGVFVNQPASLIEDLIEAVPLDFVQLHGDEPAAFCARFGARAIKAVALAGEDDLARIRAAGTERVLIDAPSAGRGGSGIRIDRALVQKATAIHSRLFVAGGLTADNVHEALFAHPYAVDVASGVEREPGLKDETSVYRFIQRVKETSYDPPR